MTPENATPAASPELAALTADAAALDQEHATAAQAASSAAPAEAETDWNADATGIINIACDSLSAFYPSTEAILTDDKRAKIAGSLAPVLAKHGWSLASIFGKWGEEIALAFTLSQVAIPVAKAIRADRAAKTATSGTAPAAPAAPAASGVPPASEVSAAIGKAATTPAATLYGKA